jgi:hypothetical protein
LIIVAFLITMCSTPPRPVPLSPSLTSSSPTSIPRVLSSSTVSSSPTSTSIPSPTTTLTPTPSLLASLLSGQYLFYTAWKNDTASLYIVSQDGVLQGRLASGGGLMRASHPMGKKSHFRLAHGLTARGPCPFLI